MGVTNPGAVAGSWVCLGLTRGSLLQKDQFGMYALYSKNKPKSDSLLASHGNTFFKVNPTTRPRSASGRWGCCPELGCSPAQFSCLSCTQRCRCLPGSLLSWAEMWWVLWEGAQHPAAPILFLAEQSEYPSQEAEAMSSRGVSAFTWGAAALTLCSASQFKQVQLGDKMDLASYLLKPIQRMSKYALLLKDLIKECSEAQEQELGYLRAAEEMVKFQLRHGNDLLAMDAIRDCDVRCGVLCCLGVAKPCCSPPL